MEVEKKMKKTATKMHVYPGYTTNSYRNITFSTGFAGILIMVITSALFFSCGEEIIARKQYDYQKADSLPVDYLRELGNIRVSIEEVAQLHEIFLNEKYSFNNGMLNSANKSSGYSNSKIQALNLGVYGSDLNYVVAFRQSQDARNYLEVVIQLAQKLGVQSAFDKELIEKLTAEDTTIDKSLLLTRAFRHAEDNMYSQERAYLATLMVAGGWIESLYLATSMLKSKPHNENLNPDIFDNVYTYFNVKKMLQVFEKDCKDCKDVLIELETINAPITELLQSKYSITETQINNLHKPLEELRNKVTGKI